jgi:hypothetical protein
MDDLNAAQFLGELRRRGIIVTMREDKLRVTAAAGVLDAATRSLLAEHKRALLAHLSAAAGSPLAASPAVFRAPQTSAQQGMWLIDHLNPGNITYNIPQAWEVQATLDPAILQQAIDRLLDRHAALRSRFFEEEHEFFQAVDENARALLAVTDLSSMGDDADEELQRRLTQEARRPFALDQAPPIRFHLFRLPQGRDILFYNIHHIVADARSLQILRAELTTLYKQAYGLDEAALPPLPLQYPDFAAWAAAHWTAEALPAQAAYWKAQLAGTPPFLNLRGSREYPERRSAHGSYVLLSLDGECGRRLTSLAREEGATLFMVLVAAFAVLLGKLSGSDDVSIGTPFTQRTRPGTEDLIGLFINMLVLRLRVDDSMNFREMVHRTRQTAVDAYDNSDLPFQEVVRLLKPDPRSRRTPLFQVMFQFDAAAGAARESFLQLGTSPGTARYDLTLQMNEQENGISGHLEYATDVFDSATAQAIADQYVAITRSLASAPDALLSSIPLAGNPMTLQSTRSADPAPGRTHSEEDAPRSSGIFAKLRRLTARKAAEDVSPDNR